MYIAFDRIQRWRQSIIDERRKEDEARSVGTKDNPVCAKAAPPRACTAGVRNNGDSVNDSASVYLSDSASVYLSVYPSVCASVYASDSASDSASNSVSVCYELKPARASGDA
jgi:hypothetical protein